ncbi:hypothetical protein YC2023_098732 [Brassica napus]
MWTSYYRSEECFVGYKERKYVNRKVPEPRRLCRRDTTRRDNKADLTLFRDLVCVVSVGREAHVIL